MNPRGETCWSLELELKKQQLSFMFLLLWIPALFYTWLLHITSSSGPSLTYSRAAEETNITARLGRYTRNFASFFWSLLLLRGMRPIYLSHLWSDYEEEEGGITPLPPPHKDATSTLNLANNLVTHRGQRSSHEVNLGTFGTHLGTYENIVTRKI